MIIGTVTYPTSYTWEVFIDELPVGATEFHISDGTDTIDEIVVRLPALTATVGQIIGRSARISGNREENDEIVIL